MSPQSVAPGLATSTALVSIGFIVVGLLRLFIPPPIVSTNRELAGLTDD
jgi:hypothetical protein